MARVRMLSGNTGTYLQEMLLGALREAEIFAPALQPLQEARKSGRVAVDHALLRELARCPQRVALIGLFRGKAVPRRQGSVLGRIDQLSFES